ncbi:MAG: hypothetical protein IT207_03520 [Fimbriimonadaceae bacterium]|nr:hypothetical protein [Fimbriimonadaceae bacterium]
MLTLAAAPVGALAQASWFPYSYQPTMGCGVDPASKEVVSETIWSGSAFASDSDTWSRELPGGGYEYGVFASSDHGVLIHQMRSGTTLAWVMSSSVNGTKTWTHTIKALTAGPNEVIVTVDYYLARDNAPGVLDDADIIVGRTVTITGPTGSGGGG